MQLHLTENSLKLSRIAREPVLGVVGFSEVRKMASLPVVPLLGRRWFPPYDLVAKFDGLEWGGAGGLTHCPQALFLFSGID